MAGNYPGSSKKSFGEVSLSFRPVFFSRIIMRAPRININARCPYNYAYAGVLSPVRARFRISGVHRFRLGSAGVLSPVRAHSGVHRFRLGSTWSPRGAQTKSVGSTWSPRGAQVETTEKKKSKKPGLHHESLILESMVLCFYC